MGGLSISDMKIKISDEMDNIYSENQAIGMKQLEEKLSPENLSVESQNYIKSEKEVNEYYEKKKASVLQMHMLYITTQLSAVGLKLLTEEEKKNRKAMLLSYISSKSKDIEEKKKLTDLINQNAEENKRKMELIAKANQEEIKKFKEEKTQIMQQNKKLQEDLTNHKKEIESNREEVKKLTEDANKKTEEIKEIMKQHTEELNKIKLENEKKLKENEEKLKKEFEKQFNAKTKEMMDKKIKEAKDEFEKQEALKQKELLLKKENLTKQFNQEVENLKSKKIKTIIELIEKEEDKICSDEISQFNNSNLEKFTFDLLKSENIKKSAEYYLNQFILDSQKEVKNIEHLNVILVGPSGVGKSTLISALLKLKLKTGHGAPQTQKIEFFTSKEFPILRLADSKGIEKNNEADVGKITESVEKFIKEQINSNDPDKFIHCVWYCYTGTRLEGSEIEVLEKMSKQYTSDKLPVIIVYTRALSKKDIDNARNYVRNELKLNNEFVDIISEEDEIEIEGKPSKVPSKNLDLLVEKTLEKSMKSLNSACFEGKVNEIKSKITIIFDKLIKELNTKLMDKAKNSLSKLNEKSDIQNFYDEAKHMIFRIISSFFFLNSETLINKKEGYKAKLNDIQYELSKVCISKIDLYISNYFKFILEKVNAIANKKIDEFSEEFSKEIIEFQHEFNISNNNLLEFKITKNKLKEQLKSYIENNTYDKIIFFGNKNALKLLINPLIRLFAKVFQDIYKEGMKQKNFIEKAKMSIKVYFTKIEKEIEKYKAQKKKEPNIPNGTVTDQKPSKNNNHYENNISSIFS